MIGIDVAGGLPQAAWVATQSKSDQRGKVFILISEAEAPVSRACPVCYEEAYFAMRATILSRDRVKIQGVTKSPPFPLASQGEFSHLLHQPFKHIRERGAKQPFRGRGAVGPFDAIVVHHRERRESAGLQAPPVVIHLRQIAIAAFNRGGTPVEPALSLIL